MGLIHIYCGDGKGKTTASVGLTVRAIGSGMKVVFVQFFKNGTSSEVKILKTFENLTYLKSDSVFPRFIKMSDEQKIDAKIEYTKLLQDAINLSQNADLIVLDEINSAYNHNLIDRDLLLNFLKNNDNKIEIVLTGRNPAKELTDICDYHSEVKKIKHPFDSGIVARKGIEV